MPHRRPRLETDAEQTLRALGVALELRGLEPIGHTDRVATLTERLAGALGLEGQALREVRWGAYLHDLGKIALPAHVSAQTGSLNQHEWSLMRQHALLGVELAASLPGIPPATLELIAAHHERWDGGGYPRGLRGEAIPVAARIFAVVDAFTAMTSNSWRARTVSQDAALYQLALERGTAFQPRVVDALASILGLELPNISAQSGLEQYMQPHTLETIEVLDSVRFALCDHEGRLHYASPRYLETLGLRPREALGQPWLEHVHPEDAAPLEAAIRETSLRGRRGQPLDARWGEGSGGWRGVRFSLDLVPGAKGEPGLVLVWLEDTVADAPKERTDVNPPRLSLLAHAVAASNAAILVTDAHERIVDASPAFLRQTGYGLEEVLGRTPRILHGPKTSRAGRDALRRGVTEGRPCQAEVINYRKDGTEFSVQINIDPVFGPDGTPTHFVSVQQDTTELRRVQTEEHRLLEISQDAILITDTDGRISRLNPAAEATLERTPGDAVGQVLTEMIHPSDANTVRHALSDLRAGRGGANLETRGRDAQGWGRWIAWSLTVFPGENLVYWVGRDVTARKLAEAALRKSEERQRALIAALAEGVVTQDTDGRILSANGSAEQILGLNAEQLLASRALHPIREDGSLLPITEQPGMIAVRTGQPQRDAIMGVIRPDGRTAWLSVNAQPLVAPQGGAPHGAVVSFFDITERRRAEAALEESERQFRLLAENALTLIQRFGPDGRCLYASPASRTVLGYEPEEIVAKQSLAVMVHPDDLPRVLEVYRRIFTRKEPTGSHECRLKRKDGGEVWVEIAGRFFYDDSGQITEVQTSTRDITERKRVEAALREAYERYRSLFDAAQRQAHELELLDRIRTALALELDLGSIASVVTRTITASLGYKLADFYLLRGDALFLEHSVGYAQNFSQMQLDEGVTGRVACTGRGALIEDVSIDPDFAGPIPGIRSIVSVPLLDQGAVVGVLNVESLGDQRLTEADFRLISAVAEHVNLAISRARLHREVQLSERKYREVVEHVRDVIAQTDAQGRITFINPAWTAITDWTLEETIGRDGTEFVHPSDRTRHLETLRTAIARGEPSAHHELRILTREGRFLWISGSTYFDLGPNGALIGSSNTMTDITERRAAEITRHLGEREDGDLYSADDLQRALAALAGFLGAESAFVRGRSSPQPMAAVGLDATPDAAIEQALECGEAEWDGALGLVLRLADEERELGTLGLRWASASQIERATLHSFAGPFTMALSRAQTNQSLLEAERASNQLLEATLWAQEAERERIALGLHDGPAQAMVSAMRYVEAIQGMPLGQEPTAARHLERGVKLVGEAIRQLRETISDLIPPDLELLGLKGTITERLEQAAREEGWEIEVRLENLRLPREAEVTFYRIFTEALTNVRLHAHTRKVAVRLERAMDDPTDGPMNSAEGGAVIFELRDWGVGFEPTRLGRRKDDGGVGTISMRKRAELIGCNFELESQPGCGTSVRVRLGERRPDVVAR